jgi:hypothetical protein
MLWCWAAGSNSYCSLRRPPPFELPCLEVNVYFRTCVLVLKSQRLVRDVATSV